MSQPGFQLVPAPSDSRVDVVLPVGSVDGGEDCLQAVVVLLRNRIEFVIVTPRTLSRQAAKRVEGRRHHVVPVEVPGDLAVDLGLRHFGVANEIPRPCGQKTRGFDSVARVGLQRVARQLLFDKLRVRPIFVERSDQIIAVRPRVRTRLVFVVAVRLAVVHDVEPVTGPALAKMWRSEQAIDELFVSPRIAVGDERFHLRDAGRQAEQVEGQPADQRAAIGLGRGRQSGRL